MGIWIFVGGAKRRGGKGVEWGKERKTKGESARRREKRKAKGRFRKAQSEGEVPKAVFAVASEADGETKARHGPSPLWSDSSVARLTGLGGLRSRSGVAQRSRGGPNWVLPGVSGGRLGGLGCRLELAGALSRAGWGFAGFGSETGLSGTGTVSVSAWRAVTCHSSTSPRHTGS